MEQEALLPLVFPRPIRLHTVYSHHKQIPGNQNSRFLVHYPSHISTSITFSQHSPLSSQRKPRPSLPHLSAWALTTRFNEVITMSRSIMALLLLVTCCNVLSPHKSLSQSWNWCVYTRRLRILLRRWLSETSTSERGMLLNRLKGQKLLLCFCLLGTVLLTFSAQLLTLRVLPMTIYMGWDLLWVSSCHCSKDCSLVHPLPY